MIFTKVLGLNGEQRPTASASGITAQTMEIGATINNVVVTGTFIDGYWKNEEDWKNSFSPEGKQMYGCIAQTYEFTGMVEQEASTIRTATINDYMIEQGNNNVTCKIVFSGSNEVPVNQNGAALEEGTVSDTTHYKPQPASSVTATTATIKGDFYYWIGYTAKKGDGMVRADIENPETFTIKKQGFVGSGATYATQFNTPHENYVTVIVPKTVQLRHVEDSFGNDVTANFTSYEIDGGLIGKDRQLYLVYQEKATAGSGLERKNFMFS